MPATHPFRKKWGQNFLIYNSVAETIVGAADVHNGDSILEIGPGRGMLTRSLLERGAQVTAIEVDPALCEILIKRFEHEARFTLIDKDIMTVSPEDKKVILYKEELAGTGKRTSATDEVKQYLSNQQTGTGEKLELPQELLDLASQAEKDGGDNQTAEIDAEDQQEE